MTPSSDIILEVDNLRVYYFTSRGVIRAVDGVSFYVHRGEVLGVVGESGCGKSTLGYALIRALPPSGKIVGGSIKFMGLDLVSMDEEEFRKRIRWKEVSIVFQEAMSILNPVESIGDQIAEVLEVHMGIPRSEGLRRARELLELVGLDPRKVDAYPHELSGGQRQRVAIALAIALSPRLLIADEPTTGLDVVTQRQVLNIFAELRGRGMSTIFISHDIGVVAEIADSIAVMYAGKIVEKSSSDSIFKSPLHPYTQALLSSIPLLSGEQQIKGLPGEPPSLVNPPRGCRFHPRCPFAMEICRREEPPTIEPDKGHVVSCWLYA